MDVALPKYLYDYSSFWSLRLYIFFEASNLFVLGKLNNTVAKPALDIVWIPKGGYRRSGWFDNFNGLFSLLNWIKIEAISLKCWSS